MGIRQIIKQTILRSDLLSSQASLRYHKQPQYQSVCGGIVSIIIVLVFSAIFVNTLISVLQLQQISSTQQLANNLDSSQSLKNFMFAIGINEISPSDFQSYFSIQLIQNINELTTDSSGKETSVWTSETIELAPCNISQWTSFGISDMQTLYKRRNISQMFCPSSTANYSIKGTKDEDIYKFLTVIVTGCQSNAQCVNQTQKEQFISNWITNNDYFQVKFYILDTIVTATNQVPIQNFVQTDAFLAFTFNTGTVGTIKLADYQIDTDTSFLPWTQYDTITGYYVDSFDTSTINQSKQKYVKIDISKSTNMLTVTRQYGKIDDALSYVGGLFSLLFVAVQFFMMSYNQYRYQLSVGQSIFNYDEKGSQFKEQDFGFINYLIYSIYDWCAFFNLQPNWQFYRKYHQTREEANQQLDVRYLMKKIRYLQSVVEILINQDQQLCLSLSELPTIQNVQKKRKLSQFSKNIRQNQNIMSSIIRKRKNSIESRRSLMSENSKRVIPINQQMFPNPASKAMDQVTGYQLNFNENSSEKSDNSEGIGFLVSEAFLRIQKQKQDPVNSRIYKKIPQDIINQVKQQRKQSRSKSRIKSGQITELIDIYPAQRTIVGERISKMNAKSKKNIK